MAGSPQAFIAVDLGASAGRVMLGTLADERLTLVEAHRFEHRAAMQEGRLRWDWARIGSGVRDGLAAAAVQAGGLPIAAVCCDSWAQDFGLLDAAGELLYSPVSYRDTRTRGLPGSFGDIISPQELLRRVGSVASPITTLCQLKAMAEQEPETLQQARTLLHVADLVRHDLCGARLTDWTLATASQLRSLTANAWDVELLEALSIPHHFLPEVAPAPAVVGRLAEAELAHPALRSCPVVVAAGHDTAAASVALPGPGEGGAFLMSGTWSMLGCALSAPRVPDAAAECGLALLGLAEAEWGLFYPIMGLWLIQECRRAWAAQGLSLTFEQIAAAARDAGPAVALVDPDAPCFAAPADMQTEIARFCAETGQPAPETPGQIARVASESVALDYRYGLEVLALASGTAFRGLHVAGGGSANELLCRLTANATGLPVIAGPVEATAVGNVLLQARAVGALGESADLRAIARASFPPLTYQPDEVADPAQYERFRGLKTSPSRAH